VGRRKRAETTETAKGNGSIVDLTKELWEAAVQLRGSIEPADYKRYVLPIIFLRFLSLRFEKRRAELEALVADPKSDYHGDRGVLEDPDEYRAASTFIVPPDARWSRISTEVRGRDDVKVELDRVLKVIEDAYPERLRGLLPPIYGGSNMDAHNLRALIDLFSKDAFRNGHGEDVIGRVYEYFIGEFASSAAGNTSRRRASSARSSRCWSPRPGASTTRAAARAACSCRATPSRGTAAACRFTARSRRTSPGACVR
jgi:type I restriction enzyme M protein